MKFLIVIDMQNDFITGSLENKAAQAILPNVRRKIKEARQNGFEIIFTRDTHEKDYLNTQEGKNLPVVHCIKDSFGWQIESLLESEGCLIFDKPTFGSIELAKYLKEHDAQEIELVGVCTDICVLSNAALLKAFLPETPICVDSSCCAGVSEKSHLCALESMKAIQIKVI